MLKCLAIPRTSTLEKQEPVDIKFFREDFLPLFFIYFKEKGLILTTLATSWLKCEQTLKGKAQTAPPSHPQDEQLFRREDAPQRAGRQARSEGLTGLPGDFYGEGRGIALLGLQP